MAAGTSEADDTAVVKLLTCRYCIQLYDDKNHYPRILGCMHTLCNQCVRTLTTDKKGGAIVCPYCSCQWQEPRHGFPVNSVVTSYLANYKARTGQLPTKPRIGCGNCDNAAVGHCVDWGMDVCRYCIDSHKLFNITKLQVAGHQCDNCSCAAAVGFSEDWGMDVCDGCIKRHKLLNVHKIRRQGKKKKPKPKQPSFAANKIPKKLCEHHPGRVVSIFCVTCQTSACQDCSKSTHHNHDCIELDSTAEQSRHRLITLTQRFQNGGNPIHTLLSSVDNYIQYIDTEKIQKEKDIDEEFNHLVEKLEEQRQSAKRGCHQLCDAKKRDLCVRRQQMEGVCAEFTSVAEFADQLCTFSNPEQILGHQQQITERLQELLEKNNKLTQLNGTSKDSLHQSLESIHAKAIAEAQKILANINLDRSSPLTDNHTDEEATAHNSDAESTASSTGATVGEADEDAADPQLESTMAGFSTSRSGKLPRNTTYALQAMAQRSPSDNPDTRNHESIDLSIFNP